MSGGGTGGGGKGAGPVPQASRKLVQSLKEIVNRPEAEIYAALRECGMDPDEAVSRLLSQGPPLSPSPSNPGPARPRDSATASPPPRAPVIPGPFPIDA